MPRSRNGNAALFNYFYRYDCVNLEVCRWALISPA